MQKCFHGMKPKPPTIRSRKVAERVAKRLIEVLNPDNFHWGDAELPDRIEDITLELMRCGRPGTVISRLWKKQPLASDNGERVTHPYGWEGLDDDCREYADEIAAEELLKALMEHKRDFG